MTAVECRVCSAQTDAFMCRACAKELTQAIGDMPSLFHELSIVATKQTRIYRANGRPDDDTDHDRWDQEQRRIPAWLRSRDARIALPATALMVNLPARDLLWAAGNTLSTWTRDIAEHRAVDVPGPDAMIGWLLEAVEAARFQPDVPQMHDEITSLHRAMLRAVDRSPSRIYAGPCHARLQGIQRCQRPLYAWPGNPEITCDGFGGSDYDVGCRAKHTVAARRDWLLDEIEDALLPIDVVLQWARADLYPQLCLPPASTWRSWRFRGRLAVRAVDRAGAELYRGGDVLALVRDVSVRTGPKRRARSA